MFAVSAFETDEAVLEPAAIKIRGKLAFDIGGKTLPALVNLASEGVEIFRHDSVKHRILGLMTRINFGIHRHADDLGRKQPHYHGHEQRLCTCPWRIFGSFARLSAVNKPRSLKCRAKIP